VRPGIRAFCLGVLLVGSAPDLHATESTSSAQVAAAQPQPGPVAVPEPSEKALAYQRGGNILWLVGNIWGLFVLAMFLLTGFSAPLRDLAQRIGRKWFFVVGVYVILFSLVTFVIDLPLSYYEDFVREHAYGLSNQTFGKWFGDAVKGLLVGCVAGFLFVWIPYLLLKKSPRRWWLYTGLAAVPFLFLLILVNPIWIDPLFNKFGPMNDRKLEASILQLAERAGIAGSRVFEVDKSTDTNAVNAYVTGFGNTKRIVLWDTIIAKLTAPQLLFVMGHEMGHYVLGHVWKLIAFFSILIIATLFAIHRTADWMIQRYRHRFGFDRLSDIASFPLVAFLFNAYFLIVTPVALTFTRHIEHEADRFGLEITRDNYAGATAFVRLQSENLGVPRPALLVKLWRASHPTLGDRIDFCNAYRPWETGQPLAYGHLFRNSP
jgi:Zn-dependent protease with chaperone function